MYMGHCETVDKKMKLFSIFPFFLLRFDSSLLLSTWIKKLRTKFFSHMNCSQKKVLKRKTSVWNMFAPSESRFGFTSFNRKSTLKRQKHVLSWNVTNSSSVGQQCQTKNGVVCPSICCHDLQPWEMSKHTRESIACTLSLLHNKERQLYWRK